MPLKDVDLKTFEAYKSAVHKDGGRIGNETNTRFWVYKDVELPLEKTPAKKQKVAAFIALVDNKGVKANSALKGKSLLCLGHCNLAEGKVAFEPLKGKVPYKSLRVTVPLLLGKQMHIPSNVSPDDDGAGGIDDVEAPANLEMPVVTENMPPIPPLPDVRAAWEQLSKTTQGVIANHPAMKGSLLQAADAIQKLIDANDLVAAAKKMTDLRAMMPPAVPATGMPPLPPTPPKPLPAGQAKFTLDHSNAKALLTQAQAIAPETLPGSLKALIPEMTSATTAMNVASGKGEWDKASAALKTLVEKATQLVEGNKKNEEAKKKFQADYAAIKQELDNAWAAKPGDMDVPLQQKQAQLVQAVKDIRTTFTANDWVNAAELLIKITPELKKFTAAKTTRDTRAAFDTQVNNTRNTALAEAQDAIADALALPEDTSALDGVRDAATKVDALGKSRGLEQILARADKVDQDWKAALTSGKATDMRNVITDIDACIVLIDQYQTDHKAKGDKDDRAKFAASQSIREHLEGIKTGTAGLVEVMKYIASVENAGQGGPAKAAAVLVKLLKKPASAEVKAILEQRHQRIAAKLVQPGDNEERQREIARVLGGNKEEEFFTSRLALIQDAVDKADAITTITKPVQKAKAGYDSARSVVFSAAARGDYLTAGTALSWLKQNADYLVATNARVQAEADVRADRSEKARQAFQKAGSKAEIERIAKLMSGDVQASYERQERHGSMAARNVGEAKMMAEDQKDAKLQHAAKSRNCIVGQLLANRLINDDGQLEVVGLFLNDPDEVAKALGVAPHSKQLARVMKRLRDEPQLAKKLTSIGPPSPKNPACQMIRSTLGLAVNEEVTEVHARKAALAAMFAELRQSDVGSCFATSTAIRVHDSDPERFLSDMKELIETGKMIRDVKLADGTIKHVEVPVSTAVSRASLERKVTLKKNGNLKDAGGGTIHIASTVPVAAALGAMGLQGSQAQKPVNDALTALRTSKVQAAKSAIEALESGKKRESLLARVPGLLAEQPDQVKARAALATELSDLSSKDRDTVLAGFDGYFDPAKADHEFTVEDVVNQTVLATTGLSEADLAARERLSELGLQVREIRARGTSNEASDKVLTEYSDLSTELGKKREQFGKYDELASAASSAYLAQEDNRLLRAWEYSLTAMAEQGVADSLTPLLKKGVQSQIESAMDWESVSLFADAPLKAHKLMKARDAIKKKFEEEWDRNVRVGYDASREGKLSADGSSNKGAFCLFDKAGIDDPGQHIQVNDKDSYTRLIEGIINGAKAEVLKGESDPAVVAFVEKIAASVADKAAKNPDDVVSGANFRIRLQNREFKEPWTVVTGNYMTPLLSTYYGQDVSKAVKENKVVLSADELTGWLLKSGSELMANIPDKSKLTPETLIPMDGGPHVWNLRIGDPAVRKVLESNADADEFKRSERAKYEAQKNTPLTRQMIRVLVEDALDGSGKNKQFVDELIQKIRSMPGATAGNVLKEVKAAVAADDSENPESKEAVETRAALAIMRNVVLPIEAADGKLAAHIDEVLKKLDLKGQEAVVRSAVMAELTGTNAAAVASMSDIEKAIVKALKPLGLYPDDGKAAIDVCKALKPAAPLGLAFGDTNWGGGDHNIFFTMMRNPVNGNLEMWQCNEDGSGAGKVKSKEWIQFQSWQVVTDPEMIGGVM
jgi:hypothetical protein